MTPFDRLIGWVTGGVQVDVWLIVKIGVLIFLLIYWLFSLVVVKQVKVMCQTVTGVLEKELMVAAWVLVGLAVASLVLAVVIL